MRSAVNIFPQVIFSIESSPAVSKRRLPWPKVPVSQIALHLLQLVRPEALIDPRRKLVAQGWHDVPVLVKANLLTHLKACEKKAEVGNNLWRKDRKLGEMSVLQCKTSNKWLKAYRFTQRRVVVCLNVSTTYLITLFFIQLLIMRTSLCKTTHNYRDICSWNWRVEHAVPETDFAHLACYIHAMNYTLNIALHAPPPTSSHGPWLAYSPKHKLFFHFLPLECNTGRSNKEDTTWLR